MVIIQCPLQGWETVATPRCPQIHGDRTAVDTRFPDFANEVVPQHILIQYYWL